MKDKQKLPLAIIALICSIAIRYRIDIFICILPAYVDAWFVRLYFWNRTKVNQNKPFKVPIVSLVPYYSMPLASVSDLISPTGYPRLIKNFVSVEHDKAIDVITRAQAGKTLSMFKTGASVGNPHFSPSCGKTDRDNSQDVLFDDFAESHMVKKNAGNHSDLYAGFESITDTAVLEELLGIDMEDFGDHRANNLFVSNFPTWRQNTPLHAAATDSVSIQLMGTKTWYFVSEVDYAKIWNVPIMTLFNLPATDDELLAQVPTLHVVVQRPGDALYFGPNWAHAVATSAGPNLMFNLRFKNLEKLKNGSKASLFKLLLRLATRSLPKSQPDNVKNFPMIYKDLRAGYYKECGQSDVWQSILDEVNAQM